MALAGTGAFRPEKAKMSGKVLVLDDDVDAVEMLDAALTSRGFRVTCETRALAALTRAADGEFDAVVTDLQLDELDGLEVCARLLSAQPDLPVIVVTGFASLETAVAALRAGAHDFVTKPIDLDLLGLTVERAVQHRRLKTEVKRLRHEVDEVQGFEKLLGRSTAMKRVLEVVTRVAHTDATVLVTGESGTGKELVARAIHEQGTRKDGPFVAINCAAVPATLLESELFGHARGAFTDAKSARKGLFLEADGGTLFLDEIGEMPHEMQVKLLRALQERVVRAVGGSSETPFDARVIAATHRDLETEVHEKRFREDLYYRIHVVGVRVPPLREREGDVPLLATRFVERFASRHGKKVLGISPGAMSKLVSYHWPGNVRELENSIERAVALTQFDHVMPDDLPERVRAHRPDTMVMMPETVEELVTVDELERRYLFHVLKVVRGNKSRAARILGYDRRTLYRKLERIEGQNDPASPRATPSSAGDVRSPVSSSGQHRSPASPAIQRPGPDHDEDGATVGVMRDASPWREGSGAHGTWPATVLLVHEPGDMQELLEAVLLHEGFRVRAASTVAGAHDAGPADVVLTQVMLRDGTGDQVALQRASVATIALTRRGEQTDPRRFAASLIQPVAPETLVGAVRAALSEANENGANMPSHAAPSDGATRAAQA